MHAADKAASTRRFGRIEKSSFALITLTFSVHMFPIMSRHTINGIFLMSIGIALCLNEKQSSKMPGGGELFN